MSWDGYPEKKWLAHPRGFWIGLVGYLIATFAVAIYLKHAELSTVWCVLVGLVPALPMLLSLEGLMRAIKQRDELYKRIQSEAIAYAFVITTCLSFVAGPLEVLDILPHINSMWAGQVLIVTWSIAAGILNRRYG